VAIFFIEHEVVPAMGGRGRERQGGKDRNGGRWERSAGEEAPKTGGWKEEGRGAAEGLTGQKQPGWVWAGKEEGRSPPG
jgi:hypothetical protein